MKNFFVLLGLMAAFAIVVFFYSEGQPEITDEGYLSGSAVHLISTETDQGKLWGAKSGDRISLPPQFKKIISGLDMYTVLCYPQEGSGVYLFTKEGKEVLTGRISGNKEIGFDPLRIRESQAGMLKEPENYYYGKIFCCGSRYHFGLTDGRICNLFRPMDKYMPFGPYREFMPGCTGYMFKDETGKWKANLLRIRERTYNRLDVGFDNKPLVLGQGFDQIIEIKLKEKLLDFSGVSKKIECAWFLRSGDKWREFLVEHSTAREGIVQEVPVDQKLLNRALKMRINPTAKGRSSFDIAYPQRVGTEGASVVFLD